MNDFVIVIQGASMMALVKIAVDLGKLLKTIEQHGKRIEKIEDRLF